MRRTCGLNSAQLNRLVSLDSPSESSESVKERDCWTETTATTVTTITATAATIMTTSTTIIITIEIRTTTTATTTTTTAMTVSQEGRPSLG